MSRKTAAILAASLLLAACKGGGEGTESDPVPEPDPVPPSTIDGFGFLIERNASPKTVPVTLAGANYLAPRDKLEGTFGTRAERLDVTLLRWPGGALTEDWEDFLDRYIIEADTRDWGSFTHNEYWSLEAFLAWTQERNVTPTIVLPMKRYINYPDWSIDYDRASRELSAFVREVTSGRFGEYPVEVWEIGNEFFWGEEDTKIPEEVYADFTSHILPILKDAAQHPIKIGVQAGRLGDNRIPRVASGFTAEEKEDVDFLIDHVYVRNFDWTQYNHRYKLYRNSWGDKPIYISEWNVKSDTNADHSVYAYGSEQSAPLVRVWDAFVKNNVQYGAFWAIQQNNYTSAFPNEGEDPDIDPYIGGAVFDWLTDTVGHEQLSAIQIGDDGMYASAYYGEDDITLFVAGLESGTQQVEVQIPNFDIENVSAVRLSGKRDVRKQNPTLSGLKPAVGNEKIFFTMNRLTDQELVKINLTGSWK